MITSTIHTGPTLDHRLGLVDAFVPNQMVILLRERRIRDFPVLSPRLSLRGDQIGAVNVHSSVYVRWLREIDSSRCYLAYDVGIACPHHDAGRSYCQVGIEIVVGTVRSVELVP